MNNIERLKTLQRIRRLTRLMDTAIGIPGTKFRIGLDPILGLLPGGGDLVSAAFSAYIIILASRFRLPQKDLWKMIYHVGLESVLGSVPLLGDIFDAYYKANIRNLEILEKHLMNSESELKETAKILYEADKMSISQ